MNLPRDIVIHILSYIDNETIKNIEMPYDYYKQYLVSRSIKNKSEKWYTGVYNNLYDRCFICNKKLSILLQVMIICFNCEILLDNHCTYPTVCTDCTKYKKIIRGKLFTTNCPCCDDKRMHVAITSFS
jgi:hypothetical protein